MMAWNSNHPWVINRIVRTRTGWIPAGPTDNDVAVIPEPVGIARNWLTPFGYGLAFLLLLWGCMVVVRHSTWPWVYSLGGVGALTILGTQVSRLITWLKASGRLKPVLAVLAITLGAVGLLGVCCNGFRTAFDPCVPVYPKQQIGGDVRPSGYTLRHDLHYRGIQENLAGEKRECTYRVHVTEAEYVRQMYGQPTE